MKPENILQTGSLAGKILLESGAEANRVEGTIVHICEAFGMQDVNAFATPTGLFISCDEDDRSYAKVLRIYATGLNIGKINQVNDISRKCVRGEIDLANAYLQLRDIRSHEVYSNGMKVCAAGFAAMCFTYFFGGTPIDGVAALAIGCIIKMIHLFFDKKRMNDMVKISILSAFLTIMALGLKYVYLLDHKDTVIIGTLMLLVPGVAITNAIRDSIAGDLLSGIIRAIEACLIAVALALGAGVTMALWFFYIGGF
ncbi:MAG: threonine/serine exporter family protein [Breznakia sp.]